MDAKLLSLIESFIAEELETRERSFLPDPSDDDKGYIASAQAALQAVRQLAGTAQHPTSDAQRPEPPVRIQILNWRRHGDDESYNSIRCYDDASDVVDEIKEYLGWPKDPNFEPELGDTRKLFYVNNDTRIGDGDTFTASSGLKYRVRFESVKE